MALDFTELFNARDNSAQAANFFPAASSAVSGGGGAGAPVGVIPSYGPQFVQALAGAANVYFQDRNSQREYNKAKLEYKSLSLYSQLMGQRTEGYQSSQAFNGDPGAPGAGGGVDFFTLLILAAGAWLLVH